MLKQFKKTAYLNPGQNFYTLQQDGTVEVVVNVNLAFKPSKIFVNFLDNSNVNNFTFTNAFRVNDFNDVGYNVNNNYFTIEIQEISKEKISLILKAQNIYEYNGFTFTLDEIYLIE